MFRAFTLDCMASLIFTHIWHHLLPCWDWVWEWGFLGWRAAGRCSGWRAVRDHPQSKQGRGWVSGEKHQQKNQPGGAMTPGGMLPRLQCEESCRIGEST